MGGNPYMSVREKEVAELVKQGFQNKQIGGMLFITEKTVKFHLTSIYRKLEVNNRNQLVSRLMHEENFTITQLPGIAMEDIKAGSNIEFDPSNGRTRLRRHPEYKGKLP